MQEFVYGGKKGNGNRFLTRQACETSCFQSQDICSLPKVIGPCNAHLDQFWYDKERDECFAFTYGGCQGNGNRFDTLPFCQSRCMKGTGGPARRPGSAIAPGVDICSLEMKPGPCTQAIPAWYYEAAQVGLTLVFLSYKILENFMRNGFRMLRKNIPCFAKHEFLDFSMRNQRNETLLTWPAKQKKINENNFQRDYMVS